MRPAISDSLISGQPLYLLYSNPKSLAAVPALMLASFAAQATGSVRLQVTGSPPTISGSRFAALVARAAIQAKGNAAAIAPCSSCRRSEEVRAHEGITCRLSRSGTKVRRSVAHEYIVFDYERARHRTYNRGPYVIHFSG